MADPVSWGYVAAYLAAGTAVASGYQQNQQAKGEADLANANAETAAQQANAAEETQRRRNRSILARQRAAIAESGIGFGGSAERLQQDSAVQAELDALSVRYEGRLRGLGFQNEARFARSRGRAAVTSGWLSAAGSLLGGMSDATALRAAGGGSSRGLFPKFQQGT